MTDWQAFAGLSSLVVLAFLVLARASQRALAADVAGESPLRPGDPEAAPRRGSDDPERWSGPSAGEHGAPVRSGDDSGGPDPAAGGRVRSGAQQAREEHGPDAVPSEPELGPWSLLANVLLTHGLFAGLVVAGAVFWQVPPEAMGIAVPTPAGVGLGVGVGLALSAGNEVGGAVAERLGVDHEERLRELLAPGSAVGWVVLLAGVLPAVAIAEELLFRGALVGALPVGLGVSPWMLAAVSSVAFGLGHGAQGRGGVVVTGLLGFALAAAFVVTGSLLLVVVAHYVVNAVEFVVHEGLAR